MQRPPRFKESLVEEAFAVAVFVGSTAIALAVMASSVAAAGVRIVLRGGQTRDTSAP